MWIKTSAEIDSWGFFDLLLSQAYVVSTTGSGFDAAGESYFCLSAFNSRENVLEPMRRIQAALGDSGPRQQRSARLLSVVHGNDHRHEQLHRCSEARR